MTREPVQELPIQAGALPWRLGPNKSVEVLLVTGRRSGRWSIPKGWPMAGKTLAETAAQEAFEEAGVQGTVSPQPIGSFRHVKQQLFSDDVEVIIVVHPLWVDHELAKWPELGQRKRQWFKIKDAAKRVDSPELSKLIRHSITRSPGHAGPVSSG